MLTMLPIAKRGSCSSTAASTPNQPPRIEHAREAGAGALAAATSASQQLARDLVLVQRRGRSRARRAAKASPGRRAAARCPSRSPARRGCRGRTRRRTRRHRGASRPCRACRRDAVFCGTMAGNGGIAGDGFPGSGDAAQGSLLREAGPGEAEAPRVHEPRDAIRAGRNPDDEGRALRQRLRHPRRRSRGARRDRRTASSSSRSSAPMR